jgi:hypothetical protein
LHILEHHNEQAINQKNHTPIQLQQFASTTTIECEESGLTQQTTKIPSNRPIRTAWENRKYLSQFLASQTISGSAINLKPSTMLSTVSSKTLRKPFGIKLMLKVWTIEEEGREMYTGQRRKCHEAKRTPSYNAFAVKETLSCRCPPTPTMPGRDSQPPQLVFSLVHLATAPWFQAEMNRHS